MIPCFVVFILEIFHYVQFGVEKCVCFVCLNYIIISFCVRYLSTYLFLYDP